MSAVSEISHSERMDRKYRYTRHVFDLTRRYFLFGRDQIIAEIPARPGDTIVDVGCGTGRNIPLIAKRFPDCQIIGIDISAEMLKSAGRRVQKRGLQDRVQLLRGDAENLSPATFQDRPNNIHVLMSYSISMVPNWRKALAGAIDIIEDQGSLSIVDFGDFSGLPGWLTRLCINSLGRHDAPPCLSLASDVRSLAERSTLKYSARLSALGWYRIVQVAG